MGCADHVCDSEARVSKEKIEVVDHNKIMATDQLAQYRRLLDRYTQENEELKARILDTGSKPPARAQHSLFYVLVGLMFGAIVAFVLTSRYFC